MLLTLRLVTFIHFKALSLQQVQYNSSGKQVVQSWLTTTQVPHRSLLDYASLENGWNQMQRSAWLRTAGWNTATINTAKQWGETNRAVLGQKKRLRHLSHKGQMIQLLIIQRSLHLGHLSSYIWLFLWAFNTSRKKGLRKWGKIPLCEFHPQ